jgi:hypothetical protein
MAYTANLPTGEKVYLANQEEQTKVILSTSSASQQQSQSHAITTGKWNIPPTLFKTKGGAIARIEASRGQFFLELQRGSIRLLPTPPDLMGAEILPLQPESEVVDSWQEMPPMRPMSMKMEMGNMKMEMGKTPSFSLQPKFCSQCGAAVKRSDRFCSQCGNQLVT